MADVPQQIIAKLDLFIRHRCIDNAGGRFAPVSYPNLTPPTKA